MKRRVSAGCMSESPVSCEGIMERALKMALELRTDYRETYTGCDGFTRYSEMPLIDGCKGLFRKEWAN